MSVSIQQNLQDFFQGCKNEFGLKRDSADLIQIDSLPEGYTNSCWHNNSCPSISAESIELSDGTSFNLDIWIDYKDPKMRDCNTGYQFIISISCDDSYITYHSNTWKDILEKAPLALKLRKQLVENGNDIKTCIARSLSQIHQYGFFILS